MEKRKNPWLFIPSQYFAEGLPYVLVNTLSVAMFKSIGASNDFIGLTSFLSLPWTIKFLWGPFIDSTSTKRDWLLYMQLIIAMSLGLLAFFFFVTEVTAVFLILFTFVAFFSATHDIALDGYYLLALNKKEQALFTGIRSTFYRISMILGGGLLVALAGWLSKNHINIYSSWAVVFASTSVLFFGLYFYHRKISPHVEKDKIINQQQTKDQAPGNNFKLVFKQYFSQKGILVIVSFILLYRFGEGLLLKMAQPFLMDPVENGGLHLDLQNVGLIYGTFGVSALLLGGILGGLLVQKKGLKKVFFPMAFIMNIPNLLYVYLAYAKPDIALIQTCVVLEQFGYGFGFTAFMVYLLNISKGEFKTSHYAISTGFMALGMLIPGLMSGFLQKYMGYFWFFSLSSVLTIPGMLILKFLPEYDESK